MSGTEIQDSIYSERADLIALIAQLYPSFYNKLDPECDWPIVYIELPTGQASWHISPEDWWRFANVPRDDAKRWDGHSTEEKYRRIRQFTAELEKNHPTHTQAAN